MRRAVFTYSKAIRIVSCTTMSAAAFWGSQLAFAQDAETQNDAAAYEEVVVTGVRQSLKDAAAMKQNADQILDAISAEDIGQLPDNNIAEALQRVTGVQIGRDETGSGSGFQVRGLSQNRVEIDGQSLASSGEDRSNNFSAVDSSLFSAIEVIKSPTADMIEGALGATIKLKTFKPLEFKGPTFNANIQSTEDEIAEDTGLKTSLMGATQIDVGDLGEVGVLLNVSSDNVIRATHNYESNWQGYSDTDVNTSSVLNNKLIFRPQNLNLKQTTFDEEKLSVNGEIQWAFNSDSEISVSYTRSERTRENIFSRAQLNTNKPIIDHDIGFSDFIDDAPDILGPFTRAGSGNEFEQVSPPVLDGVTGEVVEPGVYTPVSSLSRYVVQGGTIPQGGNPINFNFQASEQDDTQETFILKGEFMLTDTLLLEAAYASARGEEVVESYNLAYAPQPAPEDNSEENVDEETGGSKAGALASLYPYYDFVPGSDIPLFGVYSSLVDPDGASSLVEDLYISRGIYALKNMGVNITTKENFKESFALDFDWELNHSFFTSVEFGARAATNEINRQKLTPLTGGNLNFKTDSVFSYNWTQYDQDFETKPNPLGASANDIPYPHANYRMSNSDLGYGADYFGSITTLTDDFFPNAGEDVVVPAWYTFDLDYKQLKDLANVWFPGRDGDCPWRLTRFGRENPCNTEEFIIEPNAEQLALHEQLPDLGGNWGLTEYSSTGPVLYPAKATLIDPDFPYKIEEETAAIYLKTNFEGELFNTPVVGNIGVRYVKTSTASLGISRSEYLLLRDEETKLKDESGRVIQSLNDVKRENDYANILPSGNINFMLQDNMFLRFAYSKTMSRPNPSRLQVNRYIAPRASNATYGNPALEAQISSNFDVSWEWYIDDIDSVSIALFRKDLSDFIETNTFVQLSPSDIDNDGLLNDPVLINEPLNSGDGTINGVELAASHTFSYLPDLLNGFDFLDGFGVQANYTFTDSSQESGLNELVGGSLPVKDLSENSFNFILFYDKYNFNFRAAYNFRDESFDSFSGNGTDPVNFINRGVKDANGFDIYEPYAGKLAVWKDEFATLDLSMSYSFNGAKIFVQATNVLGEIQKRYVGTKETTKHLVRSFNDTGATYVIGARYKF